MVIFNSYVKLPEGIDGYSPLGSRRKLRKLLPEAQAQAQPRYCRSRAMATISWACVERRGSQNDSCLLVNYTLWIFNIAMENPISKWRFIAGKIIYYKWIQMTFIDITMFIQMGIGCWGNFCTNVRNDHEYMGDMEISWGSNHQE